MTMPDDNIAPAKVQIPKWLSAIAKVSSTLNWIAACVAAILLTLMVGLVLVEIVMRLFSRSTFMTDVLVGFGVAAITFLALGWTLEQGSMIRITALTQRLNGIPRFIAELFSIVMTISIVTWLMSFVWRSLEKLWSRGTVSEHYMPIPLWIPEIIFLIGLGLLALQLLVRLLRLLSVGLDEDELLKI